MIDIKYENGVLTDKFFSTFDGGSELGAFETYTNLKDCKDIEIILEDIDFEDEEDVLSAVKNLYTVYNQLDADINTYLDFASEQLLETANEWSENKNLSRETFVSRLTLKTIYITPYGEYFVSFDADDMFSDHEVKVDGTIDNGLKNATIY